MESNHFKSIMENIRRMPNVANTREEYEAMTEQRLGSLVLLYMEHLRRALIFMDKFNVNYKSDSICGLKFDYFVGDGWANPYKWIYSKEYDYELFQKVNPAEGFYTTSLYLAWHFNKEEIDKRGLNTTPDPIEPLWIYLLRGGFLRIDQGIILVSAWEVKVRSWTSFDKGEMLLNRIEPFIDCYDEAAFARADQELLDNKEVFLKKYVYQYT